LSKLLRLLTPDKDQIFSQIIEKAISFNKRQIEKKISSYSKKNNHELFTEMTNEIVEIFYERKAILKVIFTQIEKLPKTKMVLTSNNLIIKYLEEEIRKRNSWDKKSSEAVIRNTIQIYINYLVEEVLFSDQKTDLAKNNLVQILQSNLSS